MANVWTNGNSSAGGSEWDGAYCPLPPTLYPPTRLCSCHGLESCLD